jgi:hypothetical protein
MQRIERTVSLSFPAYIPLLTFLRFRSLRRNHRRTRQEGVRPEPRLAGGDNTSPSEIGLSLLGLLFAPAKVSFLCCEAFAVDPLCTAEPPLRQTMPVGLISPVERQLGHGLAIGGKLQELLRGAHRRGPFRVNRPPSNDTLRRIDASHNLPLASCVEAGAGSTTEASKWSNAA